MRNTREVVLETLVITGENKKYGKLDKWELSDAIELDRHIPTKIDLELLINGDEDKNVPTHLINKHTKLYLYLKRNTR